MKPNPRGTQVVLRLMAIASLIVMMLVLAGPVGAATPPVPAYGAANVDGNPAEWDLTADFYSNMYRAGNPTKPVESRLFLRYDCATNTAYALVLGGDGTTVYPVISMPGDESYIRLDGTKVLDGDTGDNGTPPDFAWVGPGYDGNSNHAKGFEASFPMTAASHTLAVHVNVEHGGSQTSGVQNLTVTPSCVLGSIGDYVWHDEDRQGDQDEPVATHALANADVRLWSKNGDSLTYLGVRTTDMNGWYLFDNLQAGTYVVDCDQSDVPFSWTLTTDNDPMTVPLAAGQHFRDADFGFAGIPDGEVALGDWVWYDINLNGLQDDGTPSQVGLQCITVRLYNASDTLIGEMNTDTFGLYAFQDLPPGTYTVRMDATDPDLNQVLDFYSATKPCAKVAEWTNPNLAAALTFRPDDGPVITTPTSITDDVPSGYNPDYDYAAGASTPTAVSIQAFGGTALPLASVEVLVAAAGALVAGALAWRRRR